MDAYNSLEKTNITMHIQNIYKEGELDENRTSKWDLLLQKKGSKNVKRRTELYNLKAIIAIDTIYFFDYSKDDCLKGIRERVEKKRRIAYRRKPRRPKGIDRAY